MRRDKPLSPAQPARNALALALFLGLGLCSCTSEEADDTGADAPTSTPGLKEVLESSETMSIAEAEEALGLTLTLPMYVPEGLDSPEEVVVALDDGKAESAAAFYFSDADQTPGRAVEFLVITIDKDEGEGFANAGESVDVEGVEVFLDTGIGPGGVAHFGAAWTYEGTAFTLNAEGWPRVPIEVLRDEGMKIIRSMLN